jgi:hypothetical protein
MTSTGGSVSQVAYQQELRSVHVEDLVLVADDGATEAARAVRELLIDAVTTRDEDREEAASVCDFRNDPSWWVPVDLHVTIVHPSLEGEARWTTEADVPGLGWVAPNKTPEAHAAWVDAIAGVLRATEAPAGARYRLLDAVQEVVGLLEHQRAPTTSEENLLLEGSGEADVEVAVASAREDESLAPPGDYVTPVEFDMGPQAVGLLAPVVVNAAVGSGECTAGLNSQLESAPRLAEWLHANGIEPDSWECGRAPRLTFAYTDGYCEAHSRPLLVDETGAAACRVEVETPNLEPCPGQFGWLDPSDGHGVRRPRLVDSDSTDEVPQRICEISQLEGDALSSCRNTVACDGCSPGWCASSAWPELVNGWYGSTTDPPYFWGLRFVLGADSVRAGTATVTCLLDDGA